jgi:UDP:flavonoid glycosyltransferase YjiC (YdhE family)
MMVYLTGKYLSSPDNRILENMFSSAKRGPKVGSEEQIRNFDIKIHSQPNMKLAQVVLLLLICASQVRSKNILMTVTGAVGHLTPMYALANTLAERGHNITFFTQRFGEQFIDFSNANFTVIFDIERDAKNDDKQRVDDLLERLHTLPVDEATFAAFKLYADFEEHIVARVTKILDNNQFDLIIADIMNMGVQPLAASKGLCVVNSPVPPVRMDFNLPDTFCFLRKRDMSDPIKRLVNIACYIRTITQAMPLMQGLSNTLLNSALIPEQYKSLFAFDKMQIAQEKCLWLFPLPTVLSHHNGNRHNFKFFGSYLSDKVTQPVETDTVTWVRSHHNIIFGAFGSTTILSDDKMHSVLHGINKLAQQNDSYTFLLAFRGKNFDMATALASKISNFPVERIRLDNSFVPQKWILSQNNIIAFITHCGANSMLESLFFGKPMLGMPFAFDQYENCLNIDEIGMGKCLFEPHITIKNIFTKYPGHSYSFTTDDVATKLGAIITDHSYAKSASNVGKMVKQDGGVEQAVNNVELYMEMGDLMFSPPVTSQLPFYQRYFLDHLAIVAVPVFILAMLLKSLCKRNRKIKKE